MTKLGAHSFASMPKSVACTRVRVPGKVIITGEHAVVYGTPALACAINKHAVAQVKTIPEHGVRLIIKDFDIDQHFTQAQLLQCSNKTQNAHAAYLAGNLALNQVVDHPEVFFAAAIGASGLVEHLDDKTGIAVVLTTDLAVGAGMGSSAALVAAMLAACFKHLGKPLERPQLAQQTTQSEHWQHGHSSGLDPYICVFGGMHCYQKDKPPISQLKPLENLPESFLVLTGKPLSTTGECVDFVRQKNFPQTIWDQFSKVQSQMINSLALAKLNHFYDAIKSNHSLLCHIGVVPSLIKKFISQIEDRHGAAKVCGAGSILGEAGGLIFVTGLSQSTLRELCQQNGYDFMALNPDLQGVSYEQC